MTRIRSIYAILCAMKADQQIWRTWSQVLHRWGITEWAAIFLETAGPLTVFGAQAVYISQPLLYGVIPKGHLDALARLLEDKKRMQSFVTYLREDPQA